MIYDKVHLVRQYPNPFAGFINSNNRKDHSI